MARSPRPEQCVLAIDLGTSTCKAALFSPHGQILGLGRRATRVIRHTPSAAEADPEDWWAAAVDATREALAGAGVDPSSVACIGVCGFMHTPIGVDAAGRVVAPVPLWYEGRSAPQAAQLRAEAGSDFMAITGDSPRANHTVAKLRWLADTYPFETAKVEQWLLPKDFLRLRLVGRRATDVSDALGTLLYDPAAGAWSARLVEACGVSPARLPSILPSTDIAGELTAQAAAVMGLTAGTPVAVGCADGYATLLGSDGCSPDRVCLYLGTSAWMTRFVAAGEADPRRQLVPAPGGYHQWIGATACAGASLSWLGQLLGETDESSLIAEASALHPGTGGLFFMPHLTGERGPVYDPDARGAFIGLALGHGRGHLVRAVLEGVAFQIRRVLSNWPHRAEIRRAVLVGGGAASPVWAQILADVTHLELEVPEVIEAGALGTALVATASVGLLEDPHVAAARLVRPVSTHAPDAARAAVYDELFASYCAADSRVSARPVRGNCQPKEGTP